MEPEEQEEQDFKNAVTPLFIFEAMDRASMLSYQLEAALREHPYMLTDETAQMLLNDASSALYNLYTYLNGLFTAENNETLSNMETASNALSKMVAYKKQVVAYLQSGDESLRPNGFKPVNPFDLPGVKKNDKKIS